MEATLNPARPAKRRPRILIVDDDPIVVKAMRYLLEKADFEPIGCLTADDAMSKVASGIDAAILDIHLPDQTGLWLSQQIRGVIGPDRPIIILSGDNSMETIRSLPNAGATYFFSKPVNQSVLIEQLKEWTVNVRSAV